MRGLVPRIHVVTAAKPGHGDFYLIEKRTWTTKLRNEPNPTQLNMTKRTWPNETAKRTQLDAKGGAPIDAA